MKAQKLIGLIAFACAFVSLSAFANKTNNWFEASAYSDDPTLIHVTTNPVCEVKGARFYVFNSSANRLIFTPDSTASLTNRSDDIYEIYVSAHFTACWTNDFPTIDSDVKLALTAGFENESGSGSTNFYYKIGSGDWTKISHTSNPKPSVDSNWNDEFWLTFNLREGTVKAKFHASSMSTTNEIVSAKALPNTENIKTVEAFGVGMIKNLKADYEVAVAATSDTGATKYGSYKEAFDQVGKRTNDLWIVYFPNGTELRARATTAAPNKLTYWQDAVIGLEPDGQLVLLPSDKQNAKRITLKVDDAITSDLSEYYGVKYKVKYYPSGEYSADGAEYESDNIQIPYGADASGATTYRLMLEPVISDK